VAASALAGRHAPRIVAVNVTRRALDARTFAVRRGRSLVADAHAALVAKASIPFAVAVPMRTPAIVGIVSRQGRAKTHVMRPMVVAAVERMGKVMVMVDPEVEAIPTDHEGRRHAPERI